jgi:hypothetical protein
MTARRFVSFLASLLVVTFAIPSFAQKPANAPKNATAQCTDGTFSTAKKEQGACSKHGGVKTWWGASPTTTPTTSPKPTTTAPAKGASPATGGTATKASAPAGSTGQCNDGTYTKAKTEKGACSNHGGLKTWFANAGSTPAPAAPAPTTSPKATAPAPSATPTNPPPPPAPAATAPPKTATPTNTQAPTATKTAPADAPQGATAKCKDGTYSKAQQHRGACSRHGGVAEWYK